LDGTKNYVRGVPVWATLIALMDGDDPVVGLVSAPALGRRWWGAVGHGAYAGGRPGGRRAARGGGGGGRAGRGARRSGGGPPPGRRHAAPGVGREPARGRVVLLLRVDQLGGGRAARPDARPHASHLAHAGL